MRSERETKRAQLDNTYANVLNAIHALRNNPYFPPEKKLDLLKKISDALPAIRQLEMYFFNTLPPVPAPPTQPPGDLL